MRRLTGAAAPHLSLRTFVSIGLSCAVGYVGKIPEIQVLCTCFGFMYKVLAVGEY